MSAAIKPPPAARFAVVTNPGTLFERVDSYHASLLTAQEWARDLREDFDSVDVMAVRHSSLTSPAHLTTEF